MYHALVLVHVLSAIVALGSNATYGVWFAKGAIAREHLLFALRGVQFIDTWVANPAYGLLLVTGAALVVVSGRPWTEPWLVWALALYAALVIVAFGAYSPSLARQIRALADGSADDAPYRAAAARQTVVGAVLVAIAVCIVGLMVFRPGGS
jgi:uncharacterized membrane protein